MADTTSATQPAKPQYQPPRRSFAGPVILILMGVLLLMATMHAFDWRSLMHYFARYWPLLIIFWGLIKLVEYTQDRSAGRPSRGVGAGGVVLLIFLLIIGLSATGFERFWERMRGQVDVNDELMGLFGNTYEFDHESVADFPANASLRVIADRADVTVGTWDQQKIRVVVHKKVVADNEEAGKRLDESTGPSISPEGDIVTVDARANTVGRPISQELQIYLPKKAAIDVTTRRGDITTRNRQGDVTVATSRGDVTVEDVTGNATLNIGRGSAIGRGSVQLSKISGDVAVHGWMSDIKVSDVGGSARMDGEFFGPIDVSRIAKAVSFRSSRTELDFSRLEGDLTLDSGDLRANSLIGPLRLVTHASKDIHLDNVSGSVTLENRSGTVEVHAGKLPLGTWDISNRNGDIQVVLPAKAAFELEATATRGDISSDFPSLKVESRDRETKASGTVGSGGPRVQINNEHGNVEIRKAG